MYFLSEWDDLLSFSYLYHAVSVKLKRHSYTFFDRKENIYSLWFRTLQGFAYEFDKLSVLTSRKNINVSSGKIITNVEFLLKCNFFPSSIWLYFMYSVLDCQHFLVFMIIVLTYTDRSCVTYHRRIQFYIFSLNARLIHLAIKKTNCNSLVLIISLILRSVLWKINVYLKLL